MTFEELKETLEDFGFEVENHEDEYYVFYKHKSVTHFDLVESRIFLTHDFYKLSNVKKAIVLRALAGYIEELPEKKFIYQVPKFLWVDEWDTLNRDTKTDTFALSNDTNSLSYQTHFTDAEVEDLIKEHGDDFKTFIEMCKKVEVE